MNSHAAVGLAVLGVMLAEGLWRNWRRRRHAAARRVGTRPEVPLRELQSSSGRVKAVAYAHDERVLRVEVFRLVEGEADERYWRRVSGPSFADRGSVMDVMEDGLRRVSGDRSCD